MTLYFYRWSPTCKRCGEQLPNQWAVSRPTPITNKDENALQQHFTKRHKDCGGTLEWTRTESIEERESPFQPLMVKPDRKPGSGRQPVLKPCPNCGTELEARERRVPCKHCGMRYDDALDAMAEKLKLSPASVALLKREKEESA